MQADTLAPSVSIVLLRPDRFNSMVHFSVSDSSTGLANGDGNIKIVYVAGYSTIPPDVVLAANMLAAYMLKMAETSGLIQTSQSLGPHSEAFDTDLFKIGMQAFSDPVDPAGVVGLLKPYRRLPWSSMQ